MIPFSQTNKLPECFPSLIFEGYLGFHKHKPQVSNKATLVSKISTKTLNSCLTQAECKVSHICGIEQ